MQKLLVSAIAATLLVAASSAFAQPTQIGGNVSSTVTVNGAMTNVAVGNNNHQTNDVCTVYEDTTIKGNLTQKCIVNGAMTNVAVGNNNRQSNDVGSIGAPK